MSYYTYTRTEKYLPKLTERNNYDEWELSDKVNMMDNAHEKAAKISNEHEPDRLPDDLEKEFPEIRINDCIV